MPHVLLLTATIAPRRGLYAADHNTPRNRLDDYKRALGTYLDDLARGTFGRIVFAENSESDLSELRALAARRELADRIDFVSVAPGPTRDVSLFYLELDLLTKAFARSELAAAPDDTLFWKVTGRYIIENLGQIVRGAPEVDLYVHSRDRPTRWTDFYLAAFTRRAFATLLADRIDKYDSMRSGEEILRETVDAAPAAGFRVVPRLRRIPRLSGTRGHDRFNYGGLKGRARYLVRVVIAAVLPKLWI